MGRDIATPAESRALGARQLEVSDIEDMAFPTQVVASELVTNATRYGDSHIQLRLLRNQSLICEVSDGSLAAPHLRYTRTTDGGGRGLFKRAEPTQRWGTRYSQQGKTIWTEQSFA